MGKADASEVSKEVIGRSDAQQDLVDRRHQPASEHPWSKTAAASSKLVEAQTLHGGEGVKQAQAEVEDARAEIIETRERGY